MRTSPVIPAMVAAATIALIHGCTLPLAGVSPSGAGGDASTTASSAGGATATAAATTSGGGSPSTTSATAASSSTGVVECTMAADCPAGGNCTTYSCTAGSCVKTFINEGVAIGDPNGNCEKTVCVGGTLKIQNDDADFAEDGDPCTLDACDNGTPTHLPGNDGVDCGGGGGKFCADGKCVECVDAGQCTGGVTLCQTPTCDNGTCAYLPAMEGADCAPASGCHAASTCASGACVQHDAPNGTSCTNVISGKCAGGGCCVFATCGATNNVCCGFGQFCNGSNQCKP